MEAKKAHLFTLQSLIDINEHSMRSWDEVLKEHNLEIEDRRIHAWKSMHPQKVEEELEAKLQKPYLSFRFLKQAADERLIEKLSNEKMFLKESALDYLQKLKQGGKFLALISAKDKAIAEKILKHFSLNYYFDQILFTQDQKMQILEPEIFLKLLKEEGLVREAAVTYGSTLHAVKASRQAKIDCVYLPDQKRNKQSFDEGIYTTRSFSELYKGVNQDE